MCSNLIYCLHDRFHRVVMHGVAFLTFKVCLLSIHATCADKLLAPRYLRDVTRNSGES